MTITGADIKRWQREREVALKMLADDDLTGDLLALGLVILAQYRDQSSPGKNWLDRARIALGWEWWKVRHVIDKDAPHYRPIDQTKDGCRAPMIRRTGVCGKHGTHTWTESDPTTGEGVIVTSCSRHYPGHGQARDRYLAWVANGSPRPPANTGGILARYFTTGGLSEAYAWARPDYDRDGQGKPPKLPRPTLRLIRGEGE